LDEENRKRNFLMSEGLDSFTTVSLGELYEAYMEQCQCQLSAERKVIADDLFSKLSKSARSALLVIFKGGEEERYPLLPFSGDGCCICGEEPLFSKGCCKRCYYRGYRYKKKNGKEVESVTALRSFLMSRLGNGREARLIIKEIADLARNLLLL